MGKLIDGKWKPDTYGPHVQQFGDIATITVSKNAGRGKLEISIKNGCSEKDMPGIESLIRCMSSFIRGYSGIQYKIESSLPLPKKRRKILLILWYVGMVALGYGIRQLFF